MAIDCLLRGAQLEDGVTDRSMIRYPEQSIGNIAAEVRMMTFLDLWCMIKKYWYFLLAAVALCLLLCYLYLTFVRIETSYPTATSAIVVNSQIETTAGVAISNANEISREHIGVVAQVKPNDDTMTVFILISGEDAEANEALANETAEKTVETVRQMYPKAAEIESAVVAYEAQIVQATTSCAAPTKAYQFYIAFAIGGLCVVLCGFVLFYCLKRPVTGARSLEEAVGLPVLEELPATDSGERLLANLRFAAKDMSLSSICVIPASSSVASEGVCEILKGALEDAGSSSKIYDAQDDIDDLGFYREGDVGVRVLCCESLAGSIQGAYVAQRASVSALVVIPWVDSLRCVNAALNELRLTDCTLAGLIVCNESSRDRARVK